jgi:hypothetical protein
MIKLILQKKEPPSTTATKSSVCSAKVLDLLLLCPILVLVLGILGFLRKGAAPLVGQLGVEMALGFFIFIFSSLS